MLNDIVMGLNKRIFDFLSLTFTETRISVHDKCMFQTTIDFIDSCEMRNKS